MLNIKKIKEVGLSFILLWNLFVILIILPNLVLILFDFTYLFLRPKYMTTVPGVVHFYDPYLGIEPHRTTDDYLKFVDNFKKLNSYNDKNYALKNLRESLLELKEKISDLDEEQKISLDAIISNMNQISDPEKVSQLKLLDFIKELRERKRKISKLDSYIGFNKTYDECVLLLNVLEVGGLQKEFEDLLLKMDLQVIRIVEENPFYESGQTHVFKSIQVKIKDYYNENATPMDDENLKEMLSRGREKKIPSTAIAFAFFWRNQKLSNDKKVLFFEENFKSEFRLNYFRTTDLSGKLTNNFYILDLPFYIFFLLEFFINWYISIRDKKYNAPFLYPLYHWYDVLGLIPLSSLHFFRLFRLYKIYEILKESEFTTIGDDIISRTMRYYSNIMKEEISDMVTIQILTETQEEIKSGSSLTVLTNAINDHRQEIKEILIQRFQNPPPTDRVRKTIDEIVNLVFQDLPISAGNQFAFQPMSAFIFQTMGSISKSIAGTERGKKIIEKTADLILDEVIIAAGSEEINRLNRAITVDLLENVKKQVAVKKWIDTKI